MSATTRIYYDQAATRSDLHAYLNKLVQYIGPTPMQAAHPHSRSARIQARKTGQRDAELAAIDVTMMTPLARETFASLIESTGRADSAQQRFPNLVPLMEAHR